MDMAIVSLTVASVFLFVAVVLAGIFASSFAHHSSAPSVEQRARAVFGTPRLAICGLIPRTLAVSTLLVVDGAIFHPIS